MKIFIYILFFTIFSNCSGQFLTFYRFSNTVYYEIEDFSNQNLCGTNIIFGDSIVDRYIKLYSEKDSIKISFSDTSYYFTQIKRKEPNNCQETIIFFDRGLRNDHLKIKSLRLLDFISDTLIVRAKIDDLEANEKYYEIVNIDTQEISGIFLGSNKIQRSVLYGVSISGAILIGILLFI